MIDPLAEIVTLLEPAARFSKVVSAAGRWRVRRSEGGDPFYCVLLEGSCYLTVGTGEAITLEAGDFVLIPSAYGFSMSSLDPATPMDLNSEPMLLNGEFRLGEHNQPHDVRFLVGHCVFGSPDATLLVSLLPQFVHVRGDARLSSLVQLVVDESRAQRPAREVILVRLLEVLFIEALRSTVGTGASPGLLRGLADERLAVAIRRMHENMNSPWTVVQLAKEACLSRSAFFERFTRAVGVAPMEYLLAWRMSMARKWLLHKECSITEVAERVGYGSASAFSVAFTRHVGIPPARYARGGPDEIRQARAG